MKLQKDFPLKYKHLNSTLRCVDNDYFYVNIKRLE